MLYGFLIFLGAAVACAAAVAVTKLSGRRKRGISIPPVSKSRENIFDLQHRVADLIEPVQQEGNLLPQAEPDPVPKVEVVEKFHTEVSAPQPLEVEEASAESTRTTAPAEQEPLKDVSESISEPVVASLPDDGGGLVPKVIKPPRNLPAEDPPPEPQIDGDLEQISAVVAPEESCKSIQTSAVAEELHAEESPPPPQQIEDTRVELSAMAAPAEEEGLKEEPESIGVPVAAAPVEVGGESAPFEFPSETISIVDVIPEPITDELTESKVPAANSAPLEPAPSLDGSIAPAPSEEAPDLEIGAQPEEPAIPVELPSPALPPVQNERLDQDDSDAPAAPARYRLRARSPASRGNATQRQRGAQQPRVGEERVSLSIHVRLLFEMGGFCAITLMPERSRLLPEGITVKSHAGEGNGQAEKIYLTALSETWFQDVSHPSLSQWLAGGAIWSTRHEAKRFRWSLSSHQLYVLGPRNDLSGFVSLARLVLGQTHVVLCVEAIREQVLNALAQAGADGFAILPQDYGAPPGWIAIRDVTPTRAVPAGDDELLNPLRPLPDLEVVLEGGIRLSRSIYLAGFPPSIRLRGQRDENTRVLIDGLFAVEEPGGSFTSEGWDRPGAHTIFCIANQSYSIEEAEVGWESSEFEGGDSDGLSDRLRVTGALIQPEKNSDGATRFVTSPVGSPLLLGAVPGEIFLCAQGQMRSASLGFAPFDPVWAVPADPLHARKETSCVQLFGKAVPVAAKTGRGKRALQNTRAWCDAILNCGRKQLSVQPANPSVVELWSKYRQAAREIRRAIK